MRKSGRASYGRESGTTSATPNRPSQQRFGLYFLLCGSPAWVALIVQRSLDESQFVVVFLG